MPECQACLPRDSSFLSFAIMAQWTHFLSLKLHLGSMEDLCNWSSTLTFTPLLPSHQKISSLGRSESISLTTNLLAWLSTFPLTKAFVSSSLRGDFNWDKSTIGWRACCSTFSCLPLLLNNLFLFRKPCYCSSPRSSIFRIFTVRSLWQLFSLLVTTIQGVLTLFMTP